MKNPMENLNAQDRKDEERETGISRRKLLAAIGGAGAAMVSLGMLRGIQANAMGGQGSVQDSVYGGGQPGPNPNSGPKIKVRWYDVQDYHVKGDGTTDDAAAISALIMNGTSGMESTLYFPAGEYRFGSNLVVPDHIRLILDKGALLSPDAGVTITIQGPIEAGLYAVFGGDGRIIPENTDVYNPLHFGALGDGATDDTVNIQKTIDAAVAAGGGVVWFPPGRTYMVSTLNVQWGLTFEGYGAIVKRLPNQGKWVRTFTTPTANAYMGTENSPPLIFRGLTIDGNRQNQGDYDRYQLEQAHLIFVMGSRASKGRLCVSVEDCFFKEGVADAISVYNTVSAKISNCTAENCFRGGVVVTGGYTDVEVTNFKAHGSVHSTGIDVEVDGYGYEQSYAVDIMVDNLFLPDGEFDVAIKGGSTFVGNNIIVSRPLFNLYADQSMVKISNSVFHIGVKTDVADRIIAAADVTFENCTFVADASRAAAGSPRTIACVHFHPFFRKDCKVKFYDCDFKLHSSIQEGDTVYAVYFVADKLENNNQIVLDGCHIAKGFDYGLYMAKGGTLVVKNSTIDADTGFYLNSTDGGFNLDVTIDGLTVNNGTALFDFGSYQSTTKLITKNCLFEENRNAFRTRYNLVNNAFLGGRVIVGDQPPTGRSVPGLVNDIFRLRTPVPGSVLEWVCTESSATSAIWKTMTTLGS